MNKNRLEAFSDGVFAIVITLIVLNVKVPDVHIANNNQLNQIIRAAAPKLLSFGFSFLVIGIFWIAHHRIFSFAKVVDTPLLWLNLVYLMFNALIPFPASILADNFFMPTTILIYTGTLFLISMMHFIILEYIIKHEDVKHEALTKSIYRSATRSAIIGPVCFILAAASSFVSAYLSLFFVTCALFFSIFIIGKNKVSKKLIAVAKEELE
ncbi:TMEM175 family protein [uncultured Mucilaginibacter sp.]|uniref:TMEM175 family protein n=1 Tax=uncultured Mucilaginibacter sp. TaxID=797541 RepID=UPI0026320496|nr:TMEM175 family protein [uncultured Mucilaginibacter sp.]